MGWEMLVYMTQNSKQEVPLQSAGIWYLLYCWFQTELSKLWLDKMEWYHEGEEEAEDWSRG